MGQYLYPLLFCWFIPLAVCYLVANSCSVLVIVQLWVQNIWYFWEAVLLQHAPGVVWVFLQALPGLIPPQPRALPLQRPLSVLAGAGLPRAWCDTVSPTGAAGTQGNKDVSQLSIPREQEAFCGKESVPAV